MLITITHNYGNYGQLRGHNTWQLRGHGNYGDTILISCQPKPWIAFTRAKLVQAGRPHPPWIILPSFVKRHQSVNFCFGEPRFFSQGASLHPGLMPGNESSDLVDGGRRLIGVFLPGLRRFCAAAFGAGLFLIVVLMFSRAKAGGVSSSMPNREERSASAKTLALLRSAFANSSAVLSWMASATRSSVRTSRNVKNREGVFVEPGANAIEGSGHMFAHRGPVRTTAVE